MSGYRIIHITAKLPPKYKRLDVGKPNNFRWTF